MVELKEWELSFAEDLAELANNRNIWINLLDHFPHPYSLQDAMNYIQTCIMEKPVQRFAITYEGKLAGAISLKPPGINRTHSAEIGYWIGEPFWGKGLMSEAVQQMTEYGFQELKYQRIFANVFSYNTASMRILEKCGYKLEAVLKDSFIKDGKLIDEHLYVCFPK